MMPGVFMFRMASGLVQLASGAQPTPVLIGSTVIDGFMALLIILAISLGLIVPKLILDYGSEN